MKILFFRHGQTHLNREQRLQGVSNPPLDSEGKDAVIESAKKIPQRVYTRIYTSPLVRAQQTAELIESILNIPVHIDERLTERNLGKYEGLTQNEAMDLVRQAGVDPFSATYRPPEGGESISDVMPRAKSFLTQLHQQGEPSIVVVHGAWTQAAAAVSNKSHQSVGTAEFYEFEE